MATNVQNIQIPVAATAPALVEDDRDLFKLRQALAGRARVHAPEAARLLDCHVTTVRRLVQNGVLRADWERNLAGAGSRYAVHVDSLIQFAVPYFEARRKLKQRAVDRLDWKSIHAEQQLREMNDHKLADELRELRIARINQAAGGDACQ